MLIWLVKNFFCSILMALASLLIIVVMLSSCSLSFLANLPDFSLGSDSSSDTSSDTSSNTGTSNDSDYTFDENTPIEGVSLASAYINEKGELILVYTNGKSQNLGVVVGKDGSSSSGDVDINITGTGADVSSIVTKGIKSAVSVVCKTENKSTIFEECSIFFDRDFFLYSFIKKEFGKSANST